VAQNAPVARVIVTTRNQETREPTGLHSFVLRAGHDTAEANYTQVAHDQAQVGQRHKVSSGDSEQLSYDYVTELSWDTPQEVVEVEIVALPFGGELSVRGLALIDQRDRSSVPLLLTSRGHFVQVHSGDVKIYQALDVLPRAYPVHQALFVQEDAQAVSLLSDPNFDPSQVVILHTDAESPDSSTTPGTLDASSAQSHVTIQSYQPHEIVLQVHMERTGYVVLSDTWYPGWHAWLDEQPTPIERANLVFRAVRAPQGSHTLTMSFLPASYTWGMWISLSTLTATTLAALLCAGQALRQAPRLDDRPTLGYNADVTQDTEGEK
jgi:hypothetical protein